MIYSKSFTFAFIAVGLVGVIIFGIVAYYAEHSNSAQAQPAKETVALTSDELFSKKMECQKYEQQAKDEVNNQSYPDFFQYAYFDRIFYSSKRNSCLYSSYTTNSVPNGASDTVLRITDVLTNEVVWQKSLTPEVVDDEAKQEINSEVQQLQ
jgi:hypothetical protein